MKNTILTIIYLLLFLSAQAQVPDYATTKEKVYLQTNHVYFEPGDTLYYKAYVVDAQTNTPTPTSTILNVDIISPSGSVLSQLKHLIKIGYAEGGFKFNDSLSGGIYKIRAYTTWMQNEKDSTWFTKALTLQKVIAPRLLISLDFPEKGYGPGDTIKAKYAIRTLDNKPLVHYTGQFKINIDGKQYITDNFKTDTAGKAIIKGILPTTLNTSDGLLNVTIIANGFTESISRSIPIELNNIDLQFMPEGGTLVTGLPTMLAFKAINEKGKPVDVKGIIIDDKGKKITDFASYHAGMGVLPFTPAIDRKYTARVGRQEYLIPPATEDGMILNLLHSNGQLYARIATTTAEDITLTASMREHLYYTTTATLHRGAQLIKIDTADFPTGIVVFTLRNSRRLKVAERVIFINKRSSLQVKISTDKTSYQPREKVQMTITTTNSDGRPVPSNLSLSVIDDKLWTMADDRQDHILSWLLMSSELKGKVEEPQFYFKQDEPKADSALDILMLTQGYRYFAFTEIVNTGNRLTFTPDKVNIMSGIVTDKKGNPLKTKIYLFNIKRQLGVEQKTSSSGQFYFTDVDPGSEYCLMAEGTGKDSAVISIVQNGIGNNRQEAGMFKPLKTGLKEAIATYPSMVTNDTQSDKPSKLSEVVVIGYGQTSKRYLTSSVSVITQSTIFPPDPKNVLLALQCQVSGILVHEASGNPAQAVTVQIRGINSLANDEGPLYVLDGVPVQSNILKLINPKEISNISILKGADATAVYGSRAASGAILLTTKRIDYEGRLLFRLNKTMPYTIKKLMTPAGDKLFSQAPVFYTPKYLNTETDTKNDFRETIYWNPTIQTDRYGKASVEFYNSDANTTFRAITEGIGYNGIIGRDEYTYAVHDAVSVDAKIPPYINVGDKVQIPVVLKNYDHEDMVARIRVVLPEGVSGDTTIQEVPLKKNGDAQAYLAVTPNYPMSGNIRINVNNQAIFLPFTVEEKAFPMHVVFSGNQSKDTSFRISNIAWAVNPKITLDLQSVPDQIMDAVKSMLREPHGCFEQTSSTTFPNILILQLMKSAKNRDYELEKKAKDYLENGYNRLIKFETSENGFEWFGRAPAHVALTAYGLLEFTAMKEFIDVDKGMLNRTEKFLMDHRDGKGGFRPTPGGADQFRAVPPEVLNAYIVYALSQTDAGREIQPEYEYALKTAKESNEGYQLSMMALAADNLHKTADFNDLLNRLDLLFKNKHLPLRTSVVASQGISLYVETMAMYAMALMREPAPRKARIAQIISDILSKKNYAGFGSTQGNVQALTALAAYFNLEKSAVADSTGTFTLNGKVIKPGDRLTSNGLSNENKFAARYNSREGIPYTFRCDYYTNTPPTSENALLKFETKLSTHKAKMGETVRMNMNITNTSSLEQGMAVVKVGIPGGLSLQPWQLKELVDKNQIAYYEIFDNYLVCYWRGMSAKETRRISLDLKVDVPGTYQGKAGEGYFYYQPEDKYWQAGETVEIIP